MEMGDYNLTFFRADKGEWRVTVKHTVEEDPGHISPNSVYTVMLTPPVMREIAEFYYENIHLSSPIEELKARILLENMKSANNGYPRDSNTY